MAMTFQELKDVLSKEGLKFFEDPRGSRIMLGMGGMHGRYDLMIALIDEGQFLQFRTMRYLECPAGSPNVPALLRVITALNLRLRLVKFAWDEKDGEVLAYADCWLVDGKLTQKQFSRMLANLMPAIDLNSRRLRETIETGEDPGEVSPEQAVEDLLGDKSLPEALRSLLKKIKDKKPKDKKPDDPDEIESI